MYLEHRREFPKLLDAIGCKTAAEIGVYQGYFSRQLLQSKSLESLWLVDPWYDSADLRSVRELSIQDSRVHLHRESSVNAAKSIPDCDFIYIDAMHEYEFIKQDIEVWWPKTKMVLAGHDWAFYNVVANAQNGVVLAAEEAFGDRIHVTGCADGRIARLRAAYESTAAKDWGMSAENVPSWYVFKE